MADRLRSVSGGRARRRRARRGSRTSLATALLGAVLLTGCAGHAGTGPPGSIGAEPWSTVGPSAVAAPSVPPTARDALPAAEPTDIEIPAIGVRARVGKVGLNPDGTVETPPLERAGDTGWYRYGPTPGEPGPAVILGHVDSRTGPAVFFLLHTLHRGDLIRVHRADGRTAVFRATAVEQVAKARFPTERVYGDLDHAGLRLVTCGGTFDRERGSYLDNVIVYAVLDRALSVGQ